MNYEQVAKQILENVGGKQNISFATFCFTRLRLTPKDHGLVNDEAIKGIKGVVGTKVVGAQYQVIIGQEVEGVYKEFCKLAGIETNNRIDENKDEALLIEKEKLSVKGVLNSVMETVGGIVAPMLPIIMTAGLLKLLANLMGPTMLNLISDTGDLYRLLNLVGDAGFYFFPIYVAYGAAKKFRTSIPLALFLAAVMLSPTFIEIVNTGNPFTVYGIPMYLTSYSNNFISMIFATWVMSYVERWLNKVIPTAIRGMFAPLFLILIMLPLTLCVFGPIGSIIGEGIATVTVKAAEINAPLTCAVIGAVWPVLIMTGMHQAVCSISVALMASNGYDPAILVGPVVVTYSMIAISLAYLLKAKDPEDRSNALSSFITIALGGISEPTLFGVALKYKKAIAYMALGGFAGGFYAGLMGVVVYYLGPGNLTCMLDFAGEMSSSFVHGTIASVIAFVVTFGLSMILGFENNGKKLSFNKNK